MLQLYVQENHSKPSTAEGESINNLLFIRLVQSQYFLHLSYITAGLLKFHAVAEPRSSSISAKLTKTREIPRNSTKYMSVQHI